MLFTSRVHAQLVIRLLYVALVRLFCLYVRLNLLHVLSYVNYATIAASTVEVSAKVLSLILCS